MKLKTISAVALSTVAVVGAGVAVNKIRKNRATTDEDLNTTEDIDVTELSDDIVVNTIKEADELLATVKETDSLKETSPWHYDNLRD